MEAKKLEGIKWVDTPPPPDRSLMENAKRLNYLATNKKDAASNIGRILSMS